MPVNVPVEYKCPACPVCGISTILTIPYDKYEVLMKRDRPFIQDIFPDWSNDKRELLITGTHASCWDELFPEEE